MYHEVEWTSETIQRFWNYYGGNAAAENSYFSRKFGARIVGLARRHGALEAPIVDMGCGPGYLSEELVRAGLPVRAVDASPRSVEEVNTRLAGRAGFQGASVGELDAIPAEDGSLGTLFLVEVLEHLPAEARERVLREIARAVRPGGSVVVTVPNEEDLDAKKVACPECGCVFHRVQHMQRMDAGMLRALLEGAGFEPVFVEALNFRHFPDRFFHALVRLAVRRLPALGGAGAPHLVAIGRRRAA